MNSKSVRLFGAETIDESGTGDRLGGSVTYCRPVYELLSADIVVERGVKPIRFRNVYTEIAGNVVRTQSANLEESEPIQPVWFEDTLHHLVPVLGEVNLRQSWIEKKPAGSVLAINVQGWTRRVSPSGTFEPVRQIEWLPPHGIDTIFYSEEDVSQVQTFREHARSSCEIVVETEGVLGASIWTSTRSLRVTARDVSQTDPTGAGDVFSSGFCGAYFLAGWSLEKSARFASAIAGQVVRGIGTDALKDITFSDVEGWMEEVNVVEL